jgi:hypothetical protein
LKNRYNVEARDEADEGLADAAWKSVLVKDSSAYKKTATWTVMNVTNAKMKLGMGMKKSLSTQKIFVDE